MNSIAPSITDQMTQIYVFVDDSPQRASRTKGVGGARLPGPGSDPRLLRRLPQAPGEDGLHRAQVGGGFHLPSLRLTGDAPPVATAGRLQRFSIEASDDTYPLDRVQVFVNDVPANFTFDGQAGMGSAGLSLLDENKYYYYATQDINSTHPQTRGLTFDQIEGLLDGISARRKLLLVDTCHAGEVD